jgi:SAM-dependent methyltransferase
MAMSRGERELATPSDVGDNQRFYDRLWGDVRLRPPPRFNTWPLLAPLAAVARRRLEVGAGMRPRLPLAGTHFVDISRPALRTLRAEQGLPAAAEIGALPFGDASFDLVCAFDIVEHVSDDGRALAEIARVARAGAPIVLSVPLYMRAWTFFDDLVGHRRRYEPETLGALLATHGIALEQSAAYGMQPRSTWLLRVGMWWLEHHREHAMKMYDRIIMPLALRAQRPLALEPGLPADPRVDEVVLLCRRG